MEKSRLIAVVCAVMAAVLVMLAGKSCTEDINKANEAARQKAAATAPTPEVKYPGADIVQVTSDPLAAPETGAAVPETETVPPPTDIFGNVIETQPATDMYGFPIEETETSPDAESSSDNGETQEVPTEEETTLSVLDQYNEDSKHPPKISGYNHGQYDEEGNLKPTLPKDFVLEIG